MSTHSICFHGKQETFIGFTGHPCLSEASYGVLITENVYKFVKNTAYSKTFHLETDTYHLQNKFYLFLFFFYTLHQVFFFFFFLYVASRIG